MKIIWSKSALNQLKKIENYIQQDSFSASEKVIKKIIFTIEKLIEFPEIFEIDRFKRNNDGTFRAFVVYKIRISYRVYHDSIYILRIRHSYRKPIKL